MNLLIPLSILQQLQVRFSACGTCVPPLACKHTKPTKYAYTRCMCNNACNLPISRSHSTGNNNMLNTFLKLKPMRKT